MVPTAQGQRTSNQPSIQHGPSMGLWTASIPTNPRSDLHWRAKGCCYHPPSCGKALGVPTTHISTLWPSGMLIATYVNKNRKSYIKMVVFPNISIIFTLHLASIILCSGSIQRRLEPGGFCSPRQRGADRAQDLWCSRQSRWASARLNEAGTTQDPDGSGWDCVWASKNGSRWTE